MNVRLIAISIIACLSSFAWADSSLSLSETTAQKMVRQKLKDPDSARFGKFTLVGKEAACLTVNAKNSYGGYSGDQQAFVRRAVDGIQWVVSIMDMSHQYCIEIMEGVIVETEKERERQRATK